MLNVLPYSRAARARPQDVHHPQASGALLSGPQGGERVLFALSQHVHPGAALLHHGHSARDAQSGIKPGPEHAGAPGHGGARAAHSKSKLGGE